MDGIKYYADEREDDNLERKGTLHIYRGAVSASGCGTSGRAAAQRMLRKAFARQKRFGYARPENRALDWEGAALFL